MTPADLAARHPRLFHLTAPESHGNILRHGLLSTSDLLTLFEVHGEPRRRFEEERRPTGLPLEHPVHGRAWISDNQPLTTRALAGCLENGLTPSDWLRMLKSRVFFWPDERDLAALAGARLNRVRERMVLVVDTLKLAGAYGSQMELSPINSGSTIRRPAKRGRDTFTPLEACSFEQWRRRRGKLDRVREIVVRGGVPDLRDYLVEVRILPAINSSGVRA